MNKMLINNVKPICMICIKNLKTPENLLRHIKTVHLLSSEDATRIEREILICNECSKIFFNRRMIVVHMAIRHRNVRSKKQRIECPKCLKMVRCNTIWSHCQFEDILSVACCPICLTKFTNTAEMQSHILTHPNYFYCNICTYSTKSAMNFKEHVSKYKNRFKHVGNVDKAKLEQCFVSSVRYMQWRILRMSSFKGLNLPPNINICVLCREICRNSEEMKKHYLTHVHVVEERVEKKKYVCTCGEEFFNSVLLKHHVFKMQGEHRAL
ncbi:PR domain zinc finger protein 15-like [Hyposmocoma kahamanoa]|uniref:PR domain zinc finger protein 15-like n=1 Tax=Hyposmocoma kahamanoa TaxID=1477025 RepID=UPI000E6D8C7C|nr:PR domain zinc finger protein 15-like [Hyposmocoma kahamanoa]